MDTTTAMPTIRPMDMDMVPATRRCTEPSTSGAADGAAALTMDTAAGTTAAIGTAADTATAAAVDGRAAAEAEAAGMGPGPSRQGEAAPKALTGSQLPTLS